MNTHLRTAVGLQAIDHQNSNPLGPAIELCLRQLRESRHVTTKHMRDSMLSSVITKHTNIKNKISVKGHDYPAAVQVPYLDDNHPLLAHYAEHWRVGGDAGELFIKGQRAIGWVDRKRGRVEGVFKNVECTFYLGTVWLEKGAVVNIRQMTGIILHEIGHVFSYFELIGRTATANYILANLSARLLNTDQSQDVKIEFIEKIGKNTGMSFEDPTIIARAGSKDELQILLLSDTTRAVRKELGENVYDERGFEKLADQFATRMGYGKDVVTGLDAVYRQNPLWEQAYRGWAAHLFVQGAYVMWIMVNLAFFKYSPIGAGITIFAFLFSDPYAETYDPIIRRYKSIRNDMVRRLKAKGYPPAMAKQVIADIDAIDKVMEALSDKPDVQTLMYDTLRLGSYSRNLTNIQMAVEDLASNEAFVAAARLKEL